MGKGDFFALSGSNGAGKPTTNGVINGIFARKLDDVSTIPAFFPMPMTYLVSVFFSIDTLPGFCRRVSMVNPIPCRVNTFCYGLLGRGSGIDNHFASFCWFFLLGDAGGHSITWHLQFTAVKEWLWLEMLMNAC